MNAVADKLLEEFQAFYHSKMLLLVDRVMPHIRNVNEEQPGRYKRIIIPFTDGSTHPLGITADIEKAIDTNGRSIISDIEQTVTLAIIDDQWKEHLRSMDELKASTNLASFEQKDPLVIYKMEAYKPFRRAHPSDQRGYYCLSGQGRSGATAPRRTFRKPAPRAAARWNSA